MTGLNAGDLDREITIKTATKTQDASSGEEVIDWDLLDETIYAEWLPAGTREAWFAQNRLGSQIDGIFRIYDRTPRPTPDGTRILFDNRIFDVKPVVEVGRGEALEVPVVARGEGTG